MMKWWGWGDPKVSFEMDDKPNLWPWIKKTLGIENERPSLPIRREEIQLPQPTLNTPFLEEMRSHLQANQIQTDEDVRLLHSYGKSFPDLFRVRKGIVRNPPDVVIYPRKHDDVVTIIRAANKHDVTVIPFGGGTNIVGCVESTDNRKRMVVSLDMQQMNRLVAIDRNSLTATIEAGALGPKLEEDLENLGYNLGHAPDSFEYSTLGGWIATRSAGMQSDEYGRIEDMVIALKVVTPSGEIMTKHTPATSAGMDVNRFIIGSEGILGVITEATMRIHPAPEEKDYSGFLFKNFDDGTNAIHQCYQEGIMPTMFRFQDSGETELAMNMKSPKKGLEAIITKGMKIYLKKKGYTAPCIMVIGFEGRKEEIEFRKKRVLRIIKHWGGFGLGKSVGKTWSKDKYNVPYLRDYVMDRSCFADVAETAAVWSNILRLYHNTIKTVKDKFSQGKIPKGYIGCHISHSYKCGASLYFTYAAQQEPGRELEQYYDYKKMITDTFMDFGGTLSHHHAVGYEHLPWLAEEVGETGMKAFKGLKNALDPQDIMNPGKIIPNRIHEYIESEKQWKKGQDKKRQTYRPMGSPPPPV
jgi:alkyldihydroxyacetonephosphate synthase